MPTVKYPPETVAAAVDYLQASLSFNDEFQLATTKKEDLGDLYYSLGANASGMLGLWSGNEALIESCRIVSGNKDLAADDASMLIIGLLWERLQAKDNNTALEPAAEKTDVQEIVTPEELLMSEVIQAEALINILDRKGIINKKELQEEIMRVKGIHVKS